jgi:YggT family protein
MNIFYAADTFISYLVNVLVIAIILRAIFSWFNPSGEGWLMRVLIEVTEPILGPLRRVMPTMGMLDLSPFVAIILLQIVGQIVQSVLRNAALNVGV